MDAPLLGRAPRQRQLQRLEVGEVLAQDRGRAHAVEHRAVAGDDVLGLLDERQRAARASRGRRCASRPSEPSGSRPARGSRRTRARLAHGIKIAIPSATWPSVGCSSSSRGADLELAGHRQRLELSEPQRARALDVVLVVERAQLRARLRRARRVSRAAVVSATPSAASGNASRPSRWSQSPCVASRPEQGQPTCPSSAAQRLELVRQDRRVDDERLASVRPSPSRAARGRRCRSSARYADVQTSTSSCRPTTRIRAAASYAAPSSFAASSSVLTSAVGFLALGSSFSLRRLTQITGTLALMQGSRSA